MRKALLGPCWEIDIQSAVWRCYSLLAGDLGVRRPPALSLMLTDRTGFRSRIAEDTMGDIPAMRRNKIEVVKEALTAIGFTAKISHDVYARPTALQDIIRNKEARERFRSHKHVRELSGFIKELLDALKKHAGYSEMAEGLIGTIYDDKVNWPKFLAWLYQQTETRMRKAMTKAMEDSGRRVVLECHDGIYVLGGGTAMDLKLICEHALQRLWDLPNGQHFAEYPSVSVEKIPRFEARMTNAERK